MFLCSQRDAHPVALLNPATGGPAASTGSGRRGEDSHDVAALAAVKKLRLVKLAAVGW